MGVLTVKNGLTTNGVLGVVRGLFHEIGSTNLRPIINAAFSEPLHSSYQFHDYGVVTKYLQKYSYLTQLLFEAYPIIKEIFGEAQLILEVREDVELVEGRELVLHIGSTLPREEARKFLDELDEKWWLDAVGRANNKMSIELVNR